MDKKKIKTKINGPLPKEAEHNFCVNRWDNTPIYNENVWKDDVIFVSSLLAVSIIGLLIILTGVLK